jgi:hypothetical protein
MTRFEEVASLVDEKLIYGIGVSWEQVYTMNPKAVELFLDRATKIPNLVIHVINGLVNDTNMELFIEYGLKVLVLGYKEVRRGIGFAEKHETQIAHRKNKMSENILSYCKDLKVCSFDNLAIKQLSIEKKLGKEVWDKFYMGDDGQFTMYVDMVNREYSMSSTSDKRKRIANKAITDIFSDVVGGCFV